MSSYIMRCGPRKNRNENAKQNLDFQISYINKFNFMSCLVLRLPQTGEIRRCDAILVGTILTKSS